MKRIFWLSPLVLAASCGPAGEPSASSNARARQVLERLVIAAGGDSVLNGIATMVAQYQFIEVGTDGRQVEIVQARDFTTGRNLYEVHTSGARETWDRVVMVPGRAFSVNLFTNEVDEYDTPAAAMAAYSELQLRWYVYLPVLQALRAETSLRHVGDTTIADVEHDIISYLHDDLGEVRLYIDRQESRLRRQSWMTPGPVPRSAALAYFDYSEDPGIPMPMAVAVLDRGSETARYDMIGVQLNVMLQDSAFEPPSP